MISITLINLASPYLANQLVMPPLGVCYVSAALKAKDVDVKFVDFAQNSTQHIPQSEFYAIGATTPQFHKAKYMLWCIRQMEQDAEVCLGGPHGTMMPEESLESGFSAVIVGEAENAIFDFLNGRHGIIAKHDIHDLDSVLFPDRSIIEHYDYRIDGLRSTTMITSRGCPYRCAFCCKSWSTPRYRSPENVLDEARQLKDNGYDGIQFYDDEFLVKKERDFEIFRGLKELDIIYRFLTRSNLVTEEIAQFLARNNCREVYLGIESGSDTILKAIQKETTVELHKRAIMALHDAGIRVKTGFVIGLPSESDRTLHETRAFCRAMQDYISDWDFTILVPYPGSNIYQHPEQYDIFFDKDVIYSPYKGGDWKSVVYTSALSAESITNWRNALHREFKGEIY